MNSLNHPGYNMLPTMMLFMTVSVLIFQATMVGLFALQVIGSRWKDR